MAKKQPKKTSTKDLVWEDEYTVSDIFWEYESSTGDSVQPNSTFWIPVKNEGQAKYSSLLPGSTGSFRSKICWVREVPNEKYEVIDITDWKVENRHHL
jgi:hypothetical protein